MRIIDTVFAAALIGMAASASAAPKPDAMATDSMLSGHSMKPDAMMSNAMAAGRKKMAIKTPMKHDKMAKHGAIAKPDAMVAEAMVRDAMKTAPKSH